MAPTLPATRTSPPPPPPLLHLHPHLHRTLLHYLPQQIKGWVVFLCTALTCVLLESAAWHPWRFQLLYLAVLFAGGLGAYANLRYRSGADRTQASFWHTVAVANRHQRNDVVRGAVGGLVCAAALVDRTSVFLHSLLFFGFLVPLLRALMLLAVGSISARIKTMGRGDLFRESFHAQDAKIERIALALVGIATFLITGLLHRGILYGLCFVVGALATVSLVWKSIDRVVCLGTGGFVGLLAVVVVFKHTYLDSWFNLGAGMLVVLCLTCYLISRDVQNRITLGNELVNTMLLAVPLSFPIWFVLYCMLAATNPWWIKDGPMNKYSLLQPSITPSNVSLNAYQISNVGDLENLTFPLIFKPDECTTSSRGVIPVYSRQDALAYLKDRDQLHAERTTLAQDFFKVGWWERVCGCVGCDCFL